MDFEALILATFKENLTGGSGSAIIKSNITEMLQKNVIYL